MFHLKNYRQTIVLMISMILGVIVGLICKEKAEILAPLGDLFLNLLLVVIPPLIFLTISTSIAKIASPNRLRENTNYHFIYHYHYFSCCCHLWYFNNLSNHSSFY